jgi:hypothetical protein
MSLLDSFLGILERAIQNPSDKAAVKIAIDGMAAWNAIASNPLVMQLESDIGAYVALTTPATTAAPAPAPATEPPAPSRQSPQDFNRWQAEHPNA